jgi:hypothetical protein
VLYPAALRDLLMHLALSDLFRAKWTHAIHEELIMELFDVAPSAVCAAARRQRENLKKPAKSVNEFLDALERLGLVQTVSRLRQFSELI